MYITKIARTAGLTVMLIGFLTDFQKLMNPKIFGIGALIAEP